MPKLMTNYTLRITDYGLRITGYCQLSIIFTCLLLLVACSDDHDDVIVKPGGGDNPTATNSNKNTSGPIEARYRLEFPKLKGGDNTVVVHKAILNKNNKTEGVNYCVEWDPIMKAQRWSCYQMYSSINYHSSYNVTRYRADNDGTLLPTCQYPNDPDLPLEYRFPTDPYRYSGYDHGHICPSADRLRSEEANYQTFYITNMQPQRNKFNAGLWEKMESQIRSWAATSDTLYVCKGGTIDAAENIITYIGSGDNRIPVPKYFFMAAYRNTPEGPQAIGFWVEHKNEDRSNDNLGSYVVNIYELQKLTDIDFFCNLPDDTESKVENLPVANVKREWEIY